MSGAGGAQQDADKLRAPTVERDGSRRWLYPERRSGAHAVRRRSLAVALIAVYLLLPFLTLGGHPLFRFDIDGGIVWVLGRGFRFSETYFLAIAAITVGFGIAWTTSLFGRAWCGYACPQTVFLDWMIRPIEELWEGPANARRHRDASPLTTNGIVRKVGKHLSFALVIALLSHTFLAYFVEPRVIWGYMRVPPLENPVPFLIVLSVGGALYFNFVWFREQFCSFLCPYARFQSVLIQSATPTVAYDAKRGDPRGRRASGACIDCGLCNRVCPTGIDIRQGLQLECIQCMRCADACDMIMGNLGRPKGLIRMASQRELQGEALQRPVWQHKRSLTFLVLTLIFGGMLLYQLDARSRLKIDVMRLEKTSFARLDDGSISNTFTLHLSNRSNESQSLHLKVPDGVDIICPLCDHELAPNEDLRSVLVVKVRSGWKTSPLVLEYGSGESLTLPLLLP